MGFKIIWSDSALADLESICTFLAKRNPDSAHSVGRGILDHVGILAQFPLIGPSYPHGATDNLREIVYRSYRIFYDVDESREHVEILHIWHASRREPCFEHD